MKILQRIKNDKTHAAIKGWSLNLISIATLACMTTSAGHTSDREIYQGATGGNASILMMLDNSQSMDEERIPHIRQDYPNVTFDRYYYKVNESVNIYKDDGSPNNTTKLYEVVYKLGSDGNKYYDRLSRLKMALIPMLANPKSREGFGENVDLLKYKIGLGSFFGAGDPSGGKIDAPVNDLTLANRIILIDKLRNLTATTYTPIANAYAEAGAYMLGTTTSQTRTVRETRYEEVGYFTYTGLLIIRSYDLYKCDTVSTNYEMKSGKKYYPCASESTRQLQRGVSGRGLNIGLLGGYQETTSEDNGFVLNSGTTHYYRAVTKDWIVEGEGWNGFANSDASTKDPDTGRTTYHSPMPDTPNQCDGYGVYFLTDGQPNGSYSEEKTRSLMNTSLVGSSLSVNNPSNPKLTSERTNFESGRDPASGANVGKPAWELIGEYAKALYSNDNSKNEPIATATVGFGSVYKELADKPKIPKIINRPGKPPETVDVYQCDASGISQDAKNLCKLGEKGYSYGEGGFYYTEEPRQIADSVKSFIEEVGSTEIESISTGTMSVPLDSLGSLKSRQFAYLPILEPVPGSPKLWNGNLKKYNVINGTLKGGDNNFVFKDSTGLFANNTYDIWNTIREANRPDARIPDRGLPQVGGAYQKILENANSSIVGDRNLFVDTGSSLTNLKVTNKKPVGFGSLTNGTNNNNDKKLALLNFMGYSEPDTTTTIVTDNVDITFEKRKTPKLLGGVLHSIPQLITQKVNVDASGQFDTRTRKDYIIYGSMDGALHMLDDSTGQETFTFVPKQILDLQPDALSGRNNKTAIDGSYPYGVDAPWLTYVSYTTKKAEGENATTINTYEAVQSFALGGLRMGGSMYYALDVTKVNEPKMIYSVGSNYANREKGSTTVLSGTKNGVTNNTGDDQKAYARMGQTWGKPTLGYVKRGGKRVMVSFLPGGYDACYENPKFKLATTVTTGVACSKTAAQGNAVYMVEMGEVKTDDTTQEEAVQTSTNNGKLLWWASNQGNSANSTSRTDSLPYSRANDLKHSIVTQVRAVDRNYDGLTDHIYFADLGGQVWRADINNNADTEDFKVDRVVKVLDVSNQVTGDDAPPRIYERPLITFYNGKYRYKGANGDNVDYTGVQAMITVGTGDRSNPVSAERNQPDALYTFIDKDVSRRDLFDYDSNAASTISLRTPAIQVNGAGGNKLKQLTFTASDIGNNGIRRSMTSNAVQGWYMPFNTWLSETMQTTGPYKMKMFNEPDALAGVLISSTYNPDVGQNIQSCSAGVKGSTQRERTCLPYGACLDNLGNDVVTARSTFNAGSGIVDNIISQYNNTTTFGSLVNRCEGENCKPEPICRNGNCSYTPPTVNSGINVDKRINPLSWMEH